MQLALVGVPVLHLDHLAAARAPDEPVGTVHEVARGALPDEIQLALLAFRPGLARLLMVRQPAPADHAGPVGHHGPLPVTGQPRVRLVGLPLLVHARGPLSRREMIRPGPAAWRI